METEGRLEDCHFAFPVALFVGSGINGNSFPVPTSNFIEVVALFVGSGINGNINFRVISHCAHLLLLSLLGVELMETNETKAYSFFAIPCCSLCWAWN